MKMRILAAVLTGVVCMTAFNSTATAQPNGNAYGYWAGRLCDHVGRTTNGMTYWESRGYVSRGACVSAEAQSLARGEWNPADWPL